MYFARLHECLEEDYEALHALMGHAAFERLCRAYLKAFPSRHYSLNPLGRRLPDFLKTGRALYRDVATLENAMSEVFDETDAPALGPADFAKRTDLETARLAFVPAFRLLAFGTPANAIVSAVKMEKPLPPLRRARTFVAVYRKDYRVWRMDLAEPAFRALEALRAGRTVAKAVEAAARVFPGSPAAFHARLRRWFGQWSSEGFFRAPEPASRRGPSAS
jgi:hypothetical protein